ncbi:hypothetical protein LMIY3S_00776 [Labrys miyagiensis]
MIAAEIFRDWRAGMIAGATLLHLTALAGAWVLIPPGTETRLNRPIEASFAPAPSSDAVNMNSAPLAQEVDSPNTVTEAALEDTAEVVPPDAVRTEEVTPPPQESVKPDAVDRQVNTAAAEPLVPPEKVVPEASDAPATAAVQPASSAPTPPQQVAVLAPDVLTSASPVESTEVPLVSSPQDPARDVPAKPPAESPKHRKPEKPRQVHAPRKKTEPPMKVQPPVKEQIQETRFAKLDTSIQVRRAQKGGAGAISDVGVSDNALTSGAVLKDYRAVLFAAVNRRLRARNIDCRSGATVRLGVVVSVQGSLSSVQLVGASGDSSFDGTVAAIVRSTSLSEPPPKKIATTLRLTCPNT